jgi:hypothetical protein
MSREKELIVAIGKLLEKEMRALEGDAILCQMQLDQMEKESIELDLSSLLLEKDGFAFTKYIADKLEKKMSFMKYYYEQEGKYAAYNKISELMEKFLKD